MVKRIKQFRTVVLVLGMAGLLMACSKSPEALLASAKDYLGKNDNSAAIIQLKNALSKNPDLAEARYLLGKAMLDNGDAAAAEIELRKAQKLKYDNDQLVPTLADALLTNGESKKVLDEMAGLKLVSARAQASLDTTLGMAYASQGQMDQAQEQIAQALTMAPNDDRTLVVQARLRLANKDLQGAESLLDKAVSLNPGNAEAWTLKGDLENVYSKPGAAAADFQKAIEQKKNYWPAHEALFMVYLRQNKLDDAGKQIEQIKKQFPNLVMTKWLETVYVYQKKDFAHARELVEQVLKSAPNNPRVLTMAGSIYLQLNLSQQAESSLNQALAAQPNSMGPRMLLAELYLRGGSPAKAVDILEPMLGQTQDPRLLELAGKAYFQSGNAAKANEYFAAASRLAPDSKQDKISLALSQLAVGQKAAGFSALEQLAASDSKDTTADMALISAALRQKDFDAASKGIDSLERKQPGTPIPSYLRGVIFAAKADLVQAREQFEKALAAKATYYPAVAALATLDLHAKKPDDAKHRFEALLKDDPKNIDAYLALARLQAQTGAKPQQVRDVLTKATDANAKDARAWLALVNYDLATKDVAKAQTDAQNALTAIPKQMDLVDALARAQLAGGKANDALATFNNVVEQQPNSPAVLLRMAGFQLAAKQQNDAIDSLKKALLIKNDFFPAQKELVSTYLAQAHYDDALAVADDVKKQHPKESVGFALEGDIQASRKNWNGAARAYRTALKLQPSTAIALNLDGVLRQAGDLSEASSFEKEWMQTHPDDGQFVLALAQHSTNVGNYKEASNLYRTMLRKYPANPTILNNFAWVQGQLNDPKAIDYAERAMKLAPMQPEIMDTLAMLEAKKGNAQRALALLNDALKIAPDAHAIRLDLVKVMLQMGKREEANAELKSLEKLGNQFAGHTEVQRLIAANSKKP